MAILLVVALLALVLAPVASYAVDAAVATLVASGKRLSRRARTRLA